MTHFKVEFSDVDRLADDIRQFRNTLIDEGKKVVSRGAFNIKKDWRNKLRGHDYIPRLPFDITYDTTVRAASATAEIGPEKEKGQGALGHLIELGDAEYGGVNNAPIPAGRMALDAEEPKFVAACERLAEKIVARQ